LIELRPPSNLPRGTGVLWSGWTRDGWRDQVPSSSYTLLRESTENRLATTAPALMTM
jgi:hypothetical protein